VLPLSTMRDDDVLYAMLGGAGAVETPWRLGIRREAASPLAVATIVASRLGLSFAAARDLATARDYIEVVTGSTELAYELRPAFEATGASVAILVRPTREELRATQQCVVWDRARAHLDRYPECGPPWRVRIEQDGASPLAVAKLARPYLAVSSLTAARDLVAAGAVEVVVETTALAIDLVAALRAAGASAFVDNCPSGAGYGVLPPTDDD
jgi:hypothetical protein